MKDVILGLMFAIAMYFAGFKAIVDNREARDNQEARSTTQRAQ